jgi:hypothetical protein
MRFGQQAGFLCSCSKAWSQTKIFLTSSVKKERRRKQVKDIRLAFVAGFNSALGLDKRVSKKRQNLALQAALDVYENTHVTTDGKGEF